MREVLEKIVNSMESDVLVERIKELESDGGTTQAGNYLRMHQIFCSISGLSGLKKLEC